MLQSLVTRQTNCIMNDIVGIDENSIGIFSNKFQAIIYNVRI